MMLFISCKEHDIYSFDNVYIVDKYDVLCSDTVEPWGPITEIGIIDSILVLKHANDDYNFSFVDVKNGKVLCRWGTVGDGPDDFLDFGTSFTALDSQIVFLESNKKTLNYVPLKKLLNGDTRKSAVKTENYPYTINFRPFKIENIGNKKIALGAFIKGHIGVLDSLNNIISCMYEDPFEISEIQGLNRGIVFQGEIKANEKQQKVVISTFASDVFEIYSVSDDSIRRIYLSPFHNIPQIYKKGEYYAIDSNKSIGGIRHLAVSDELICFFYLSDSYDEASRKDFSSDEILCFNWNGEKVKKYILPFTISNFCLDKNYLYGVQYFNDKTVIYRFNL